MATITPKNRGTIKQINSLAKRLTSARYRNPREAFQLTKEMAALSKQLDSADVPATRGGNWSSKDTTPQQ